MIQAIRRHEAAKRKRAQAGFTLIELLVVIIILGILAAVVVFAVQGAGDKGLASAREIDVRTIQTAQESYCAQFGRYGSDDDLVTGGFLSELPVLHQTAAVAAGTPDSSGGCPPDADVTSPGDRTRSRYVVTCESTQEGCGSGGALRLAWTPQAANATGLQDVFFTDHLNGRAVGQQSNIRRTTQGGTENPWATETGPTAGRFLNRIDCLDAETCWAVGNQNNTLWKKTAGNPWAAAPPPGFAAYRDVDFVSPQVGVVVAANRIVWTDDGGTTWTDATVSGGTFGTLKAVEFIDANNVVAGGTPAAGTCAGSLPNNNIWTSSDAGKTWVQRPGTISPVTTSGCVDIQDFSFVGQEGWLTGIGGPNVFKTSDGGQTWQELATIGWGISIDFVDARRGWQTGYSPTQILATVDGGATWTVDYSGGPQGMGITMLDIAHGWMVGGSVVLRYGPT